MTKHLLNGRGRPRGFTLVIVTILGDVRGRPLPIVVKPREWFPYSILKSKLFTTIIIFTMWTYFIKKC